MSDTGLKLPRHSVPLPNHLKGARRDSRGYVVPFFVAWFKDGMQQVPGTPGSEPDFRVVDKAVFVECVTKGRCWVCGEPLGVFRTSCIGPMCAINRITSEPPMHNGCAEYAVRVCPFLLQPNMKRNKDYSGLDAIEAPPGLHNDANPGVMLLWTTKASTVAWKEAGPGGLLISLDEPLRVDWWTRGRRATYAEAELALVDGFTRLENIARTKDVPEAMGELRKLYREARKLLPFD